MIREREEVIKDIIELGRRLKWFKPLLNGLTPNSYIYASSDKNVIDIDSSGFILFANGIATPNHDELEFFLLEIINEVVTDAKRYTFDFVLPY